MQKDQKNQLSHQEARELLSDDFYYLIPESLRDWLNQKEGLSFSNRMIFEFIFASAYRIKSNSTLKTRLANSVIMNKLGLTRMALVAGIKKLIKAEILSKYDTNRKGTLYEVHIDADIAKLVKTRKLSNPIPANTAKIELFVPFKEKAEAKALGAKWDIEKKIWYIYEGEPIEPFTKWILEQDKDIEENQDNYSSQSIQTIEIYAQAKNQTKNMMAKDMVCILKLQKSLRNAAKAKSRFVKTMLKIKNKNDLLEFENQLVEINENVEAVKISLEKYSEEFKLKEQLLAEQERTLKKMRIKFKAESRNTDNKFLQCKKGIPRKLSKKTIEYMAIKIKQLFKDSYRYNALLAEGVWSICYGPLNLAGKTDIHIANIALKLIKNNKWQKPNHFRITEVEQNLMGFLV